ncbi:MAG: AAA family ATPase [Cyclobacteriaceae bacterium]|nr:AAA family ATPase [Cyclobacteriaceae bacterium]
MNNTGFKIIAITPLQGCNKYFLKILSTNKPYYLFNNYQITQDENGIEKITLKEEPPRLYDLGKLKINISAIVGKNGSGKSSLVELLYVAFYNIAKQQRLLPKKDENGLLYKFEENINIAIYFTNNEDIFKLEQKSGINTLYKFKKSFIGFDEEKRVDSKKILEHLFYNIVVNYSHYALNENDLGPWIKAIFHKNDAYQTPIVLNPFRDEGNIDINIENHLVKSRMLVNILEPKVKSFFFRSSPKTPTKLHFSLNYDKFQVNKKSKKISLVLTNGVKSYVFPSIYEVFYNDPTFIPADNLLNKYAKEYILRKLHSIIAKYKHYLKYRGYKNRGTNALMIKYLKALRADKSHITFKLKQAINFLRFDALPKDKEVFSLNVSKLSSTISEIEKNNGIDALELAPPSFLSVDIEFSQPENLFSKLSSGEKQKTYALASVIYHLKNIESVLKNQETIDHQNELIKYKNINIIFDEIELYYHPDLQRRFIKDLIDSLAAAKFKLINSINFIFITHSPFVLSDIPEQNTLYLDLLNQKAIQRYPVTNTFGGNIHDLLSNSFFLDSDGYMGEFAKSKIKMAHSFLTKIIKSRNPNLPIDLQKKLEIRKLIDIIGEPLIRTGLNDLYADAYLQTKSSINEEVSRLENLKRNLPE